MQKGELESEEKCFMNKKSHCFIYTMFTTNTEWICTLRYQV